MMKGAAMPINYSRRDYRIMVGLGVGTIALIGAAALIAFFTQPVHATWRPEYASAPQHVRDWYENAELTPAAQRRFNFLKCCDQSETVKTKFRVDRSSGADQWFWLNPDTGAYEQVPPDIIHWGKSGPEGQAVLFVFASQPTCFFPPQSGQ